MVVSMIGIVDRFFRFIFVIWALSFILTSVVAGAFVSKPSIVNSEGRMQQRDLHKTMNDIKGSSIMSSTPLRMQGSDDATEQQQHKTDCIRFACMGNSIQYYNDCPRLLQNLLATQFQSVHQDSCLRGKATLISLFDQGNGMRNQFSSPPALQEDGSYDIGSPTVAAMLSPSDNGNWDYLILNDHTQSPARPETRYATLEALERKYCPPFAMHPDATTIFVQTPAYRKPVQGSGDLGDFDEFTDRLTMGCAEYREAMNKLCPSSISIVAPVGLAYQRVRQEDSSLWECLYAPDDFHPSPHGTWLQACVLYCTMTQKKPPTYNASWWEKARYLQPVENGQSLSFPTAEEASRLSDIAFQIHKEEVGKRTKNQQVSTVNASSNL